MIANDHRATNPIRKSAREIDRLGHNSISIRFQTNHAAANAERATVNKLTTRNRREILRRSFRNIRVAPQKLTSLGINSHHTLAQELHVLLAAGSLHDDRRCVSRGL